jgi:rhomboid family GlyGly-CTERM serine protease
MPCSRCGARFSLERGLREFALSRSAGVSAWLGLSALLALGALLGLRVQHELLDWQPTLVLAQPWRIISPVAVHYGEGHLLANLAGAGLVAALGWAARITLNMSIAWGVAWPLTHIGLLVDPDLSHYGGLSGVLHAGVAIAAMHLMWAGDSRQRRIGAPILLGLVIKIALEFPWSPASFHAELGIMVAPLAHLSGLIAGLACGAAVCWFDPGNSRRPHA